MPAASPPRARPKQTLKAAKASFRSRGQPSLSERAARQLRRSADLDRRAWGVKAREKRRSDLARERAEKEKREQAELRRVQMGTQRRKDRWGFKGSQMHLGAFLGGGGVERVVVGRERATPDAEPDREASDDFGEIDDDALLQALLSPRARCQAKAEPTRSDSPVHTHAPPPPPPPPPTLRRAVTAPPRALFDEFADCWDELGSSTQIARELAAEEEKQSIPAQTPDTPAPTLPARETGSIPESKARADRMAMPPPSLPGAHSSVPQRRLLKPCTPGENLQVSPAHRRISTRGDDMDPPRNTHTLVAGFSLDELETLVDDDLQLTQVAPG